MSKVKRLRPSAERRNWDRIFNALVQMLQTQQTQLETLVKERKLLEDRVRMQHDRWISDCRLYEDTILQMKGDLVLQNMERLLETSKLDLIMGLKSRDAFLCQLNSEQTNNELQDFQELYSLLSSKISDPSGNPSGSSSDTQKAIEEVRHSKTLNNDVQKLQGSYEKLVSENSSIVSALLAEKTFVWNQYNIMENDYKSKLKAKYSEVELARSKIESLLAEVERLQSLNNAKDGTIASLESKVGDLATDSRKLNDENSKISQELELLRKHDHKSITCKLNRCTSESRTFGLGNKKRRNDVNSNVLVKKEASSAQVTRGNRNSGKENGSLKRKKDIACEWETPKLFTSAFRPPKLKRNMYA